MRQVDPAPSILDANKSGAAAPAAGNGHRRLHRIGSCSGRSDAAPASGPDRGNCVHDREATPTPAARDKVRATVPKLIDLTEKVVYGDVWERPELSKRDRSLITCAALVALNRSEQLKGHLERALNNGVTPEEIGELITHLAFYGGWPVAMSSAMVAKEVLEKHKK